MRVVLDTNTLVSGIISSGGPPRRLLDGARTQAFESYSSAILLAELLDVLNRDKFARRLEVAGLTPLGIVIDLRRLVRLVEPADVPRVIPADPDDDHVLACAIAAERLGSGLDYCSIGNNQGLTPPFPERATPTSELNAAFTASFVGKILDNSGVNMTRLLPFLNSSKCFPRTPLPRFSRRYSARITSDFFIGFPFMSRMHIHTCNGVLKHSNATLQDLTQVFGFDPGFWVFVLTLAQLATGKA